MLAILAESIASIVIALATFILFNTLYYYPQLQASQLIHSLHCYDRDGKNNSLYQLAELLTQEKQFLGIDGLNQYIIKGQISIQNLRKLRKLLDNLGCESLEVLSNDTAKVSFQLYPYNKQFSLPQAYSPYFRFDVLNIDSHPTIELIQMSK
jgi:hypothetical protein